MKKLFGIILLILLVLMACEPSSNDVSNISLYTGETICGKYYYFGDSTYHAAYHLESEDGEIISVILIRTWDISDKSEEEVNSIITFFGPSPESEYEIDGDVLTISFPIGIAFPIDNKSEEEIRTEVNSIIDRFDPSYEIYEEILEIAGTYTLLISGFDIETWDISDKSEEEIREIIDSFSPTTEIDFEIDGDTLTQTTQMTLEGIIMTQGDLNIGTFIARIEDEDSGYSCH